MVWPCVIVVTLVLLYIFTSLQRFDEIERRLIDLEHNELRGERHQSDNCGGVSGSLR